MHPRPKDFHERVVQIASVDEVLLRTQQGNDLESQVRISLNAGAERAGEVADRKPEVGRHKPRLSNLSRMIQPILKETWLEMIRNIVQYSVI
jgi:hypothetical protein